MLLTFSDGSMLGRFRRAKAFLVVLVGLGLREKVV